MKKLFSLLVISFLSFGLSGQIPIGKDKDEGSEAVIRHMKDLGYTLYNQETTHAMKFNRVTEQADIIGEEYKVVRFKEEITFSIYYNSYGNITSVYVHFESFDMRERFLQDYQLNTWTLIKTRTDVLGEDLIFKIDDYYALLPLDNNIPQVNFFREMPE